MATLGWCRVCGRTVSDEARACPHCGQPDPYAHVEVGKIYEGHVTDILESAAIVTLPSGLKGSVHISQIARERVKSVAERLSIGDRVKVKVFEVDGQGHIRLSIKAAQ